jgi:L-ascorbate metabolism protein UlaG (beta-lactamase superfamily)
VSTDRITWLGHATVLIELGGVRLLTDPLLRDRLGHLRRHGRSPAPGATEDLDAVLISHLHLDHLDLPSLKRLPRTTRLLVPRGAGAFLRRQGFPAAEELAAGDRADVGGLPVVAVPAVHDRRRRPFGGGPEADALGFVAGGRVYFAGDTDLFDEMGELGDLDVALIPVWGWGPSLGEGHLDPPAAARAAALLRPRIAVPIHWGTFYPRGLARYRSHRLTDPPHEFAAEVARLAPDVAVRVLAPGGSVVLPE